MNDRYSISRAADHLGVSPSTLRRWEACGKLVPERTAGGQRRYSASQLMAQQTSQVQRKTVAYSRVSSHDQKKDLERQQEVLSLYCASKGWQYEIISDLGSGMNYRKKGLRQLLNLIVSGQVERLIITHKDRLLRFGAELVFALCEARNCEVVIINQGDQPSFEGAGQPEELAKDVLEIITVFSARLYGSRSRKNQQLMEKLTKVVEDTGQP
ncbi:IS607 family transposase [Endozoicomonas acroporae]|uniref:IS607 family transposase n=1 Tax=Endozoicomonas acroporae TaxID=1701104 RepID=UPI000C772864|nr:IS607 family transposase [Endozoicomonas acroporae]